jgi:tRNA-dihydrouridine synthase
MNVPLLLAPMAEISHRAFRELAEGFGGCDGYFSEMIGAGALLAGGPFERWYIDAGPRPEKCVFQLVGADSGQISRAAAILDRLECAGIDINMGCSAPLIRKTGAGAAWLASIDRAGEMISLVRPVVKRRLSVKLRIGYQDDFEYLARFCRRLEDAGVELITLHPRLVTEKFKRLARWEYVGRLRQELKIPVAGNGDIAGAQELVLRAAGPCDAVMVGRAAVRQPWIFAEARRIEEKRALSLNSSSVPNIEETGLRFLELLSLYQPPEFHLSRAMRFFGFFCDNLKFGNYLKTRLNREKTLSGIERVWKEYFKEDGAGG